MQRRARTYPRPRSPLKLPNSNREPISPVPVCGHEFVVGGTGTCLVTGPTTPGLIYSYGSPARSIVDGRQHYVASDRSKSRAGLNRPAGIASFSTKTGGARSWRKAVAISLLLRGGRTDSAFVTDWPVHRPGGRVRRSIRAQERQGRRARICGRGESIVRARD